MDAIKTIDGPPAVNASAPWPSPARGWAAAFLLTVAMFVSYVDRSILSLLVEPIKASLGLTDVEMGLLQGVTFGLVFTFTMLPCGWLVDNVNRTKLLGGAIAFWSMMTVACALPSTFAQMFMARMGVAVGEAALSPTAPSLIADYFPPERRTPPLTLYGIGGIIGVAASLIFGGLIAGIFGESDTISVPMIGDVETWQVIFVAVGAPGLLLSLIFFLQREPVRREQSATKTNYRELWAVIVSRRWIIGPHIASFCLFNIFGQAMASWLPTFFIRIHGWSIAEVGIRLGITQLVSAIIGAFIGGYCARSLWRRGRRDANYLTAAIFLFLTAGFSIAASISADPVVSMLCFGLTTACLMAPNGAILAAIQELVPNQLRGRITALYYVALGLVSMTLGPLLIGVMNDYLFTGTDGVGKSLATIAVVTLPLAGAMMLLAGSKWRRFPAL